MPTAGDNTAFRWRVAILLAVGAAVLAGPWSAASVRSRQRPESSRTGAAGADPQKTPGRDYVTPTYRVSPNLDGAVPDLDDLVTVIVDVAIGREGSVTDSRILRGERRYASAATAASRAWKFVLSGHLRRTLIAFNMGAVPSVLEADIGRRQPPGPCSPVPPPAPPGVPEQPVPPDPCTGIGPKLVHYRPPFPGRQSRRLTVEQEMLDVVIDRMGRVTQASALGPVTHATATALDAVLRWRFGPRPAPVAAVVTISIPSDAEWELDPGGTATWQWYCGGVEFRGELHRRVEDGRYLAAVTTRYDAASARPVEIEHRTFATRDAAERQLEDWHAAYLPRFMEERRSEMAKLDASIREGNPWWK